MNKSDNINELATALAKAQGAMRFAIKDAKGWPWTPTKPLKAVFWEFF